MEETTENQNNNRPWLFKKGQSGNPGGRPKGLVSMKTYAKRMLASMNEDERQEFINGLPKETIWKMAEGNPSTDNNVTAQVVIKIEKEIADANGITKDNSEGQESIQSN